MMNKNKISMIFIFILLIMLLVGIVSAKDNSISNSTLEDDSSSFSNSKVNSQSTNKISNYNSVNEKKNNVKSNNSMVKTVNTTINYSKITVGSTKNVYADDTVSIYGKLSSNSKNIANTNISVNVGSENYNLTTNNYGKYKLQIKASTIGKNTVIATFNGNDLYSASEAKTSFTVSKKTSNITIVSTKNVYVGGTVNIYGKLTSNNKGLAYKNVTIKTRGIKYNTTTNKYGTYKLKITATKPGNNTLTAIFPGTNNYKWTKSATT